MAWDKGQSQIHSPLEMVIEIKKQKDHKPPPHQLETTRLQKINSRFFVILSNFQLPTINFFINNESRK